MLSILALQHSKIERFSLISNETLFETTLFFNGLEHKSHSDSDRSQSPTVYRYRRQISSMGKMRTIHCLCMGVTNGMVALGSYRS